MMMMSDDDILWYMIDLDRISSRILSPLQWFNRHDNCPSQGDGFDEQVVL